MGKDISEMAAEIVRREEISSALDRFFNERDKAEELVVIWTTTSDDTQIYNWSTSGMTQCRLLWVLERIKCSLLEQAEGE